MAVLVVSLGAVLGDRFRAAVQAECAGSRKVAQRAMTKLQRTREDPRAVGGALRRFSNNSKIIQMQILQQLLDQEDWQLALPMYKLLRGKEWYQWNPILHARMVTVLAMTKQLEEMQVLVSETPEGLSVKEKVKLQLSLIENLGKKGLLDQALLLFNDLQSVPYPKIAYVSQQALARAYISAGLPHEAHLSWRNMKIKGFKPSLDDYKTLLHGYGSGGFLEDLESLVEEIYEAGLKLDTAGFNMMLSAYGQANKFDHVVKTLARMRELNISCSITSRNAISKCCPSLLWLFGASEYPPSNTADLWNYLESKSIPDGELKAMRELFVLGLPTDSVQWSDDVWELDLHRMFLGTANLSLFLWLQQLKARYADDAVRFPSEVRVVTGWGKHSELEGKSIVKEKIAEILERMHSPFKCCSRNRGVIVARGSALKSWLDSLH